MPGAHIALTREKRPEMACGPRRQRAAAEENPCTAWARSGINGETGGTMADAVQIYGKDT
jgi:hypothetical protein